MTVAIKNWEAAFAGNDKEMIIVISEVYLTANLFQKHKKCYLDCTRIAIKSSPAAESKSNKTGLGNRDYNFVLSLIDNDVFANCQYEFNGSIGTKQSRIKLTERLLNSYGDKLVFLQTD